MDGTLIDSSLDLTTATNLTRKSYNLPEYTVAQAMACVGDGVKNLCRKCLPELPENELPAAVIRFGEFYQANQIKATCLYPYAAQMLKNLHDNGYFIALVTNKPQGNSEQILQHLGVFEYFNGILGGGVTPALKPEPAGILKLLHEFKLEPENCAMVGDHYTDMAAGRQAGTVRIWAKWGFGDLRGEGYDYAAENISALDTLIRLTLFPADKL